MHVENSQRGPTLGETTNIDAPHSPLQELSPKADNGISNHRPPPLSVVVIQESSSSYPTTTTLNNEDSNSASWNATAGIVSSSSTDAESRASSSWQQYRSSTNDESTSGTSAPGCFSSFKLQPRNPGPFSSPSRGGFGGRGVVSQRGRKRPAHSMSIPVGSLSSSESPSRPPRPSYLYGKDDRSDDVSSTKGESFSAGSDTTAKDASLSPPIFEMEGLNLKSLSLQSPIKQSASRPRASSFQMYGYGVSPAGSVTRPSNTSASLSGSTTSSFVASGTPCSSARSSPRHVPLTVLSQGQSLMSPSMHSLVRPPRPGNDPSLLFSLDNDEGSDDEGGLGLKLPASSCNSSISSDSPERKGPPLPSSMMNDSVTMYASPSKTIASSPKTPLPRIMLTPRTPQSSCGSHRKAGLPMFPSPSDDGIDTLGTPNTQHSSIDEAMDTLLNGFAARRGHPGRYHATTGYIPPLGEDGLEKSSRYNKMSSSNSLAYSLALSTEDNQDDDDNRRNVDEPEQLAVPIRRSPSPSELESKNVDMNPPALPRSWLLPVPPKNYDNMNDRNNEENEALHLPPTIERSTQSSMPPITKHDTILKAMMDANARERASRPDSDSLSDSGEEDEFVLTCPSNLASGNSDPTDGNRPQKQRRRESQDSVASGSRLAGRRESCTSLASGLASASSLFGMEFYQDDGPTSMASPVYRSTTPYSSHSLRSKQSMSHGELSTEDDGSVPLGMHHRFRRSENSFGSLGLSLDGPSAAVDEHGRDLSTPPITSRFAFSPPPPPKQPSQPEAFCSSPESPKKKKACSKYFPDSTNNDEELR